MFCSNELLVWTWRGDFIMLLSGVSPPVLRSLFVVLMLPRFNDGLGTGEIQEPLLVQALITEVP
jgi:hypothetical protein